MLKTVAIITLLVVSTSGTCFTSDEANGSNIHSSESIPSAISEFTLKSYKQFINDTKNTTDNIVTSPFSIFSALSTTYLGSRGPSSTELGDVIGLSPYKKSSIEYRLNALNSMLSMNKKDSFVVANKLAVNDQLRLKQCLKQSKSFEVESLNFTYNADGERQNLNKWVANITNNRIKDLLPPGSILSNTALVILNAVYFKGKWKTSFKTSLTRERSFTNSDGTESKLDMMNREGDILYNYHAGLKASVVELPYTDGKFSMVLALPDVNTTVDDFIHQLNKNDLTTLMNNFSEEYLNLAIPKFKIEKSYSLKDHLSKLGSKSMFNSIDMTGILELSAPTKVSKVIHKVFVEVNEVGTEAAASTAILFESYSAFTGRYLSFDRPFIFFIKEINTNSILFTGVIRSLP